MNAFYNPEGVGDTLLISLNDIPREEIAFERCGDVVKIFHKDTKETAGYNIFNVSSYVSIEESGAVALSESFVQDVNEILVRNGLKDELTVDLSPKFVVGYVEEKKSIRMPIN